MSLKREKLPVIFLMLIAFKSFALRDSPKFGVNSLCMVNDAADGWEKEGAKSYATAMSGRNCSTAWVGWVKVENSRFV